MKHTSYSRLNTHRQCPQRYKYAYIDHYEKADPEDAQVELEFGNLWHLIRAADSIRRGLEHHSLQTVPDKLSAGDLSMEVPPLETMQKDASLYGAKMVREGWELVRRFEKSMTAVQQDAWQTRLGGQPFERLTYVDARWEEKWWQEIADERPLAVELGWEREIPGTDTALVGYVDEVFLDARRNTVVIRDHKTHKTIGNRSVIDDMMESQLQLYAWGVSPTVKSWGLGKSVSTVAYDRVRMTAPKTPVLTKSGTLSKTVTDYDVQTYVEWAQGEDGRGVPYPGLKKDGSGAGFYTADSAKVRELEEDFKTSRTWFARSVLPVNLNIVKTHLRAAIDTSEAVDKTRQRVEKSNEAGRNMGTMNCKWCPFVQLCRAEMIGGPMGELNTYDLAEYKLRPSTRSGR